MHVTTHSVINSNLTAKLWSQNRSRLFFVGSLRESSESTIKKTQCALLASFLAILSRTRISFNIFLPQNKSRLSVALSSRGRRREPTPRILVVPREKHGKGDEKHIHILPSEQTTRCVVASRREEKSGGGVDAKEYAGRTGWILARVQRAIFFVLWHGEVKASRLKLNRRRRRRRRQYTKARQLWGWAGAAARNQSTCFE